MILTILKFGYWAEILIQTDWNFALKDEMRNLNFDTELGTWNSDTRLPEIWIFDTRPPPPLRALVKTEFIMYDDHASFWHCRNVLPRRDWLLVDLGTLCFRPLSAFRTPREDLSRSTPLPADEQRCRHNARSRVHRFNKRLYCSKVKIHKTKYAITTRGHRLKIWTNLLVNIFTLVYKLCKRKRRNLFSLIFFIIWCIFSNFNAT